MPLRFNVPDLDPAAMQRLLDVDPLYAQHLAAFEAAPQSQKPQLSIALMNDFNRIVPYEQRLNSRYAASVQQTGRVDVQDRDNPWTSPGFWGPIAVGGATAGLGFLGQAGNTANLGANGSQYVVDSVSGYGGPGADAVTSAVAAGTGPATTVAAAAPPAAGGVPPALAAPAAGGGAYGPLADAYGNATNDYSIPPGLDPNYTGDMGGYSPQGPYSDAYGGATNQPEIPGSLLKNGTNLAGMLTDPKWSPLLKALAGVGGLMGGKLLGGDPNDAVPPQLTQLLDLAMQRANSQTPLFNATQKGFYDMLPNFAKTGQGG